MNAKRLEKMVKAIDTAMREEREGQKAYLDQGGNVRLCHFSETGQFEGGTYPNPTGLSGLFAGESWTLYRRRGKAARNPQTGLGG